jgi:hydroxyacylglutathione hydrolase
MPLELVTFRVLSDNYGYIVHDAETGATAAIDVADADAYRAELGKRGWTLTDILLTHHHWDHVQGAQALAEATGARITGAASDAGRLPKLDRAVRPGDRVQVGGAQAEVIAADGHTKGHIAYHFAADRLAFTADSLMALGCGRVNPEGSYDMQFDTLARLGALPDETLICSGHEYGATNARFSIGVDPQNADLTARPDAIIAGAPCTPATLALEKATNPFLRLADPAIRAHLGMKEASDREIFANLRDRRNAF